MPHVIIIIKKTWKLEFNNEYIHVLIYTSAVVYKINSERIVIDPFKYYTVTAPKKTWSEKDNSLCKCKGYCAHHIFLKLFFNDQFFTDYFVIHRHFYKINSCRQGFIKRYFDRIRSCSQYHFFIKNTIVG